MTSKYAFESVNRLFQDTYDSDEIFGGKVIIVSGDFRQSLPIIKHGIRTQIIENCIKASFLWKNFVKYSLKANKRLSSTDDNFKKWLLDISDGISHNDLKTEKLCTKIPDELISKGDLITEIFGDKIDISKD